MKKQADLATMAVLMLRMVCLRSIYLGCWLGLTDHDVGRETKSHCLTLPRSFSTFMLTIHNDDATRDDQRHL